MFAFGSCGPSLTWELSIDIHACGNLSFSFISGGTVTELGSLDLSLFCFEFTLLIADETISIVGCLQADS